MNVLERVHRGIGSVWLNVIPAGTEYMVLGVSASFALKI